MLRKKPFLDEVLMMPAGEIKNSLSIKDVINLPMTASINQMHEFTGISYHALKKLADDKLIVSIPTEGKKILLSTWSVIERFQLAPIEILKEIWMKEVR
jgi:hypothetical protein